MATFNILSVTFGFLAIIGILWFIIGGIAAIAFLILMLTSKDDKTKHRNLKRMLISLAGLPLLIVLSILWALIKIALTFFGI